MERPTESLGKRIRATEMMKVPYVLVVGEKEEQNGTVAVRSRSSSAAYSAEAASAAKAGKATADKKGDEGEMDVAKFMEKLQREINEKTIQ